MGVLEALVGGARKLDNVIFVSNINNGEGILVVVEADLTSVIASIRVWGNVIHTLGVVGVPVLRKATSEGRVQGLTDVNDVETTVACACTDSIGKSRFHVQCNVMAVAELSIVRVLSEGRDGGGVVSVNQLLQV
jgi:hypothetical protein